MSTWTRINLWLAAIAAVLLALYLWPQADPMQPRLTRLDTTQIATIRIERGNRLQLALQRSDNGWHLTHPQGRRANTRRVEQLLAVARARVQQSLPAGGLAPYGLQEPTAVLRLDDVALAFGERDPTHQRRYVLADGAVRVVDDVYFNLLTLPPSHFIGD